MKLFLDSGRENPKNPKIMKKFALLTLSLFALQTSAALAWVGGPWSNNGFSPGAETGTYQAMATMNNGTGLMRFQVTNQASFTTLDTDTSVWWYRGATYIGNTTAIVDLTSRIVAGTNTATSEDTNAINDSGTTVERLTASWKAKIRTVAPQIRFDGKGTARVFGDLDDVDIDTSESQDIEYIVEDILITGPEGDLIVTIDVDNYQQTYSKTVDSTGGQDNSFPDLGKKFNIRVFGSRTSWVAPGNLNGTNPTQRTNGRIEVPGEEGS
jgi:hypothetical protein